MAIDEKLFPYQVMIKKTKPVEMLLWCEHHVGKYNIDWNNRIVIYRNSEPLVSVWYFKNSQHQVLFALKWQ